MLMDPRGVHDFHGAQRVIVSVHVGVPADVACRRGGESHRGRAIHGDVDVIPLGMRSLWINEDPDTALILSLAPEALREAAQDLPGDPQHLAIHNRFQIRDTVLEHLAWALKAEMDCGFTSGRFFLDSMGAAVASRLVHRHSSFAQKPRLPRGVLPTHKLKQVLAYIEDNLDDGLSLAGVAHVAGLSVSHCQVLFRRSVGQPIHQYVIRRRVERAALLLREGRLPISQVALETGFSHQSHLARHMRRLLGASPRAWKNGA